MTKVARAIKAWRKRKGLNQVDAAKRLKIGQPHLSQIENGKAEASDALKERVWRVCA